MKAVACFDLCKQVEGRLWRPYDPLRMMMALSVIRSRV